MFNHEKALSAMAAANINNWLKGKTCQTFDWESATYDAPQTWQKRSCINLLSMQVHI